MDIKNFMNEALCRYEMNIAVNRIENFIRYMDLLLDWNNRVNLTAITDKEQIVLKHFVDSLALVKYMDISGAKMIDVGCGAGFPGLPLKIANDNIELTLLDSLNKRIVFLNEVIEDIGLFDVKALHGRAEDAAFDSSQRQSYDIAVSRAVARLNVLCEYCLPFVKVGGVFVAYKGYDVDEELEEAQKAIREMGAVLEKVEKIDFDMEFSRSLIFIRKKYDTSLKYPRKPALIAKKPII